MGIAGDGVADDGHMADGAVHGTRGDEEPAGAVVGEPVGADGVGAEGDVGRALVVVVGLDVERRAGELVEADTRSMVTSRAARMTMPALRVQLES